MATPGMRPVRVDRARLWANLMRLKEIGGYDDAATGLRGVRRLALTDEDAEARRLVVSWTAEAGLTVRVDRIGNVYGERAGADPSLPCVLVGSHIDTVATGGAFDGTVGSRALEPAQTNVVPARALLTVDLRDPDDDRMVAAEKHLAEFVDAVQVRHGVTATCERMARASVVPFDQGVQDVVAVAAGTLGLPYVTAMSGAGHDAQEIAATCPTTMIFAAGEHGGVSHTPREFSRAPEACGNGIDVLATAVLALAERAT